MIHTNSSLSLYNNCPRKYEYRYDAKINPELAPLGYRQSDALLIGKHVHTIMEGKEPVDNIQSRVELAKQMARGLSLARDMSMIEYELKARELELGMTMFDRKFAGKIDGIIEYKGVNWILDYKTGRGKIYNPEKYRISQQFNLYQMLAEANGIEIAGNVILYMRRPTIYERKNESADEYLERVAADIADNLEEYYWLITIEYEQSQRDEVMRSCMSAVNHIEMDSAIGFYRRNPQYCMAWNQLCEYAPLCNHEFYIEECQKYERVHQELDEYNLEFPEWRLRCKR